MEHPINRVKWVDVNLLSSNDYNPNHVLDAEMKLLAFSILKQGWIQPILVWPNGKGGYTIIDGFHRHLVTKTNKQVWAMTDGKVPVVEMDMTVPERMLLTIRINRAKGTHAAIRMHDIVASLVREHGLSVAQVCTEIGASADEVNTLLADNIFAKKRTDEYNYSSAFVPPDAKEWGFDGVSSDVQ